MDAPVNSAELGRRANLPVSREPSAHGRAESDFLSPNDPGPATQAQASPGGEPRKVRTRYRHKRSVGHDAFDTAHYRNLWWKHILRLSLTYLAPFVILTAYLYVQHRAIAAESQRLHLKAIAESKANTLDLFLSERLINLSNLINDPQLPLPPTHAFMEAGLGQLKRASPAFVDLGYFGAAGVQVTYIGPHPSLAHRSYASEPWFLTLKQGESAFVITDLYLGFRKTPHFTIAMSRIIDGQFLALRATLAPQEVYQFISSFEGAHEVFISIVNTQGLYQLVTSRLGTPLEFSSFVPPHTPRLGASRVEIEGRPLTYAYSWLRQADWALIVQPAPGIHPGAISNLPLRIMIVPAAVILLSIGIIAVRARRLADLQLESDRHGIQLTQAAKLASIGELAAGIAHEINNPLAAIGAEAGLVKDLMNPQFGEPAQPEALISHLESIEDEVIRCRGITHKLLKFVRKTDVQLKNEDVHALIDEVLDDLLGNEIMLSKVRVDRSYDPAVAPILTDGHQFQQVILNIVSNAIDAIGEREGRIGITTGCVNGNLRIGISDTGKGMTLAQTDKVFLPFFTTKEVGKGTGLGLSVSYGIVKSLGGDIEVESELGSGTTFTIVLPLGTPGRPPGRPHERKEGQGSYGAT